MNYRCFYIDTNTNTYNINILARKMEFLMLDECVNYIDTYLEKTKDVKCGKNGKR